MTNEKETGDDMKELDVDRTGTGQHYSSLSSCHATYQYFSSFHYDFLAFGEKNLGSKSALSASSAVNSK